MLPNLSPRPRALSLIVVEKAHPDDDLFERVDGEIGRVDGEIDRITGPQRLDESGRLHPIHRLHRRLEALNGVMRESHRAVSGINGLDDPAGMKDALLCVQ